MFIGPLAQLAEQLTLNQLVEGSSPSRLTRKNRITAQKMKQPGVSIPWPFSLLTAILTAKVIVGWPISNPVLKAVSLRACCKAR